MIFWRGYGILVAVLAIVCLISGKIAAESIWGIPLPVDKRKIYELTSMIVAAGGVYGLHLLLQREQPPRTLIDKESGKEVILVPKHDLFFVPVKYWPYILFGFGVLFFFQG